MIESKKGLKPTILIIPDWYPLPAPDNSNN